MMEGMVYSFSKLFTSVQCNLTYSCLKFRFSTAPLDPEAIRPYLTALIQTYLSTMEIIGVETWIMHGTLLAWWWNQKVQSRGFSPQQIFMNDLLIVTILLQIFPWDSDLDVQVSEPTIHFLANYYNMTEHHYDLPGVVGSRNYLLEVNPNYVVRSPADRENVIDARWIDTGTGLFIDITALRQDDANRNINNVKGAMMCKDGHRYNVCASTTYMYLVIADSSQEMEIFPLRNSHFENSRVKIPYDYTKVLRKEYGPKSMTTLIYGKYVFCAICIW